VKTALVCGAGGFIGGHLVRKLKREGFNVRGIDRALPEFAESEADDFFLGDLRDPIFCKDVIAQPFDEVYQLAAEIGGAEFTYVGVNDLNILLSSTQINMNVLQACQRSSVRRVFFSSSACVYPERNQLDSLEPNCAEGTAYPAEPDSEYGWEKLFSERLFSALGRSSDIAIRIARYHNIFGPEGTWKGGREKAPAALCRKIAMARDGDTIDVIGDGKQSRSFLDISECLEGTLRLMRSSVSEPINIGSEELVTINQLADLIMDIAGKQLVKNHIAGPVGVRGRNSNNTMIKQRLGWAPSASLRDGLERTYQWIEQQVRAEA
jgi:nucleoside-diphosphate-sugar epimerase